MPLGRINARSAPDLRCRMFAVAFAFFLSLVSTAHAPALERGISLSEPKAATPDPAPNATEFPTPREPAAPTPEIREVPDKGARRVAVVIGNSDYVNVPRLKNPAHDAQAVGRLFESMGFETWLGLNLSLPELR